MERKETGGRHVKNRRGMGYVVGGFGDMTEDTGVKNWKK